MCDFQDYPLRSYTEWDYIKLDEMIILCPPHVPCRDCEKFAIIQDVDTDPKFLKKVVELWKYEKEKENILTKEFLKNFCTGFKDGLNTVVNVAKKVIDTPGVTDLINIGTSALGVPVNVGDMISTGIDFKSNLLGGGSKKRDILKDLNKYDFKSSYHQLSSLIKRKEGPIWKK
jgi:uncharacterized protein YnzC (UPF0291/DUF896 family)